jgi:hypothetical protein
MRQGKDPDPEGPKTTYGSGCGSGSGILVLTINKTVGEKFHLPQGFFNEGNNDFFINLHKANFSLVCKVPVFDDGFC